MKRLLLPLLAALALPTAVEANWFGKYKSSAEAKQACNEWANEGFKYTYKEKKLKKLYPEKEYEIKTYKANNRYCEVEWETKQFLGYEYTGITKPSYSETGWFLLTESEKGKQIKKYFRY